MSRLRSASVAVLSCLLLVTLLSCFSSPVRAATTETLSVNYYNSAEVYCHERWIWDDCHDKESADHATAGPTTFHCETNVSAAGTSISREMLMFDLSHITMASNITNVNLLIPIANFGASGGDGNPDFIVQLVDINGISTINDIYNPTRFSGNLGSFTASVATVNVSLDADQIKDLAGGWLRLGIREKNHDYADTNGGMTDGDGIWMYVSNVPGIQLLITYDGIPAGILPAGSSDLVKNVFLVMFFFVPGVLGLLFPKIGLIAGFVIIALVLMTSYSSFLLTAMIVFANAGIALWKGD